MPFGSQTYRKLVWILAALSVLVPTALSAATAQQLAGAKDQFNELWHSAALTTARRAELEGHLAQFDTRVEAAKRDLAKVSDDQRNVRISIDEHRKLIDILQQQIGLAQESRMFYLAVAISQKDDIVSFVRTLASRQIAYRESGPVIAGDVLKYVLRGSLGDSVDASLAESAIVRARERFALQIGVLVSEAEKAGTRLKKMQSDLRTQLTALEKQSKDLAITEHQKTAFIDMSWKEKRLNEDELKRVQQETNEVNGRIASMQESLIKINTELRETKLKKLQETMHDLVASQNAFHDQLLAAQRKDQAMQLLQEDAAEAFRKTREMRNTDTKLYKRTLEDEFQLQLLQDQKGSLPRDASGAFLSSADGNHLSETIADLKHQLALMRDGVPRDFAVDAVQKQRRADAALLQRKDIAVQIALLTPRLAQLQSEVDGTKRQIETTANNGGLAGVPPLFQWPVIGPLTAGYFDPDYEKVFGVPHRAIDIAVSKGTPIHVVSQGIVFAVKDGGAIGYSYLLIGHQNGYASLYGHVSQSFVKAGDFVNYDQIIGLSGGEPGSHGAGPMTTGSHLHLEMMKDGEHINPLDILPRP